MGVSLFSSCLLIGYSPLFALFCLLIAKRPQLLIVTIVAAFFWLLAFLVSSIVWYIIPPFYSSSESLIPLSVIFVEISRYFYIKSFAKAEKSFSVVSINAIVFPMSDIYSSVASGVGFGSLHCFLYYGSLLSNSLGPAALFSSQCNFFSTFYIAAWNSFLFSLLHVFLMIIAFDAFRTRSLVKYCLMGFYHLSASLLTILNQIKGGCQYSFFLIGFIVILTATTAFIVARQPGYRSAKKKTN